MWITISSGVLGFSFIFGNTLSQQLQTILLIFVVHPFDVGDALLLNGAFHTVEQTSLNKARRGTCFTTALVLMLPLQVHVADAPVIVEGSFLTMTAALLHFRRTPPLQLLSGLLTLFL